MPSLWNYGETLNTQNGGSFQLFAVKKGNFAKVYNQLKVEQHFGSSRSKII